MVYAPSFRLSTSNVKNNISSENFLIVSFLSTSFANLFPWYEKEAYVKRMKVAAQEVCNAGSQFQCRVVRVN